MSPGYSIPYMWNYVLHIYIYTKYSLPQTLSMYALLSSHFVVHGQLSQKHVSHLPTVMGMVGSKFIEMRMRGIQYKYVYLVHVNRLFNSLYYVELHIT